MSLNSDGTAIAAVITMKYGVLKCNRMATDPVSDASWHARGVQGSGLTRQLIQNRKTANSGQNPALAVLFQGQINAFKEARTSDFVAQKMLRCGASL